MVVRSMLTILGSMWLFFEIGQFFQERLPIGNNPLFWPLWLCISVIAVLTAHVIDNYWGRASQAHSEASQS